MRLIDDVAMVISTSNRIDYINYAELDERGKKTRHTYKMLCSVSSKLLKVYMTLIENKFNNHRYTQINFQVIGGFWLLFFAIVIFYSMSYLCCVYLQINLFLQYLPETCISSEFKINSGKIGPTNLNIASQQYIL